VVELFEARKPRETAIISEIDGVVRFGEVSKGHRKYPYKLILSFRQRKLPAPAPDKRTQSIRPPLQLEVEECSTSQRGTPAASVEWPAAGRYNT